MGIFLLYQFLVDFSKDLGFSQKKALLKNSNSLKVFLYDIEAHQTYFYNLWAQIRQKTTNVEKSNSSILKLEPRDPSIFQGRNNMIFKYFYLKFQGSRFKIEEFNFSTFVLFVEFAPKCYENRFGVLQLHIKTLLDCWNFSKVLFFEKILNLSKNRPKIDTIKKKFPSRERYLVHTHFT